MKPEDRIMNVLKELEPGQALSLKHLSALAHVGTGAMTPALEQLMYLGLVRAKWIGGDHIKVKAYQRT